MGKKQKQNSDLEQINQKIEEILSYLKNLTGMPTNSENEDIYSKIRKSQENLNNIENSSSNPPVNPFINYYPVYTDRPNPAFPPILPLWLSKEYA